MAGPLLYIEYLNITVLYTISFLLLLELLVPNIFYRFLLRVSNSFKNNRNLSNGISAIASRRLRSGVFSCIGIFCRIIFLILIITSTIYYKFLKQNSANSLNEMQQIT